MNLPSTLAHKAQIANPALKPLDFLIGEWRTSGSHPDRAGRVLDGRTSFQWHEGGAFLMMRTQIDEPGFPDGLAIIGSDNVAGTFTMTYFDERGVSRRPVMVTMRNVPPTRTAAIPTAANVGQIEGKMAPAAITMLQAAQSCSRFNPRSA